MLSEWHFISLSYFDQVTKSAASHVLKTAIFQHEEYFLSFLSLFVRYSISICMYLDEKVFSIYNVSIKEVKEISLSSESLDRLEMTWLHLFLELSNLPGVCKKYPFLACTSSHQGSIVCRCW